MNAHYDDHHRHKLTVEYFRENNSESYSRSENKASILEGSS